MAIKRTYHYYYVVLLVTILLLCASCKDEYSFEGRAVTDTTGSLPVDSVKHAQFTILVTTDSCMDAVVKGTYRSGDTLTNANTMMVQVRVTERGYYAVTTDTVDGIYFSTVGYFDHTGDQQLILTGNGTPKEAGTFFLKPMAVGLSCAVSVSIENGLTPAAYLLIADPNNRCVNQIIHGTYTAGIPLTTSNQVTVVVDVKEVGAFTVKTAELNGMMFSYSGHFTATGYQYVVLNGTGTPKDTGSTAFIPRVIGSPLMTGTGCTFYVKVQ